MRRMELHPGTEGVQAPATGASDGIEAQAAPVSSAPAEAQLTFDAVVDEGQVGMEGPAEPDAPAATAGAAAVGAEPVPPQGPAAGGAQGVPEVPETPDAEIEVVTEDETPLRDHQIASRRQYARFLIGGKAKGRVTAIYDAVVLDISMGGSLIEHAHVVRPGTLSSLDLDLGGARVRVRCRVARSVVHRSETLPGGERELIYHTGLEFLEPPEETRRVISRYIRSVLKATNSA